MSADDEDDPTSSAWVWLVLLAILIWILCLPKRSGDDE